MNTGLGCHSLLQGLNPSLLHCRQILYSLSYQGSPGSNNLSGWNEELPSQISELPSNRAKESGFLPPNKRRMFLTTWVLCYAKSLQSCLTLCDPMDCSPPGSSVHGVLQARMLEWVAMSSSRGSSRPRDRTYVSCLLHCRQVVYY